MWSILKIRENLGSSKKSCKMKASFKPRARLLKLLGDQLIGTPQLAIFELVKNSYDADADKVEIIITNPEDPEKATIEITDFGGEGMDMDTIINVWLEPGADHKEKKRNAGEVTKKHRRLPLGEKGVGRFAVHKLGQKINLVTKAKRSPEISLSIDWNSLDNFKYIEDTEIEIVENEDPTYFTNGNTGTRIVISHLNAPLKDTDVRNLYRNIQSIKSPFEYSEFKLSKDSPTFDVVLEVPEHPEWIKDLYEMKNIISQALFKFTFFIENGKWSWFYEYNPNEGLKKEFKAEPRQISAEDEFLEFKNKSTKAIYLENPKQFCSDIGPVLGEIYVFDFDSEVKKFYSETNAVKRFLSENKGIRIYRDNIRVYNYGEPHDDWLSLDHRRVQSISQGLNRSITVGAISLDLSHTPNLVEKTNREGFIENDSFEKLREVVESCIGKLEVLRHTDKSRLRELTKSDAKSSITQIENPLEELKKIAHDKGLDDVLLPTINRVEKGYNEMRDIMLKSGMAGLNMSMAFHEIHRGIKDTKKIVESEKDKAIILKQFERFELLLDTYANLLKDEKSQKFSLKELLQGNYDLAELRFDMHKVICSCPVLAGDQPNYTVKIPPQLVTSAVNNLIDNAIYWLDQRWGNEPEKKYLYIGVSEEFDKGPAIIVADNGPGWKNISPEEVVKPFMTTKSGGMGIGLYYTNTVMEMLGGELAILNPEDVDIPGHADGAVAALIFNGGQPCKK